MSLRLYIELYSGIRKCFGKLLRDVNHNGNYLKLAKKRWTRMYAKGYTRRYTDTAKMRLFGKL